MTASSIPGDRAPAPDRSRWDDAEWLDEFLRPAASRWSMDSYHVRRGILEALVRELPRMAGTVLDVGCGRSPYRSVVLNPPSAASTYIGLDLAGRDYGGTPDVEWNGETIPLPDAAVNTVLFTEVLEHCPRPGVVLAEAARVLKPGGLVFVSVPFLWPVHDAPYDEYRYTPFALQRIMKDAGLTDVDIRPTGGWNAAMAQMMGLWVLRAPMGEFQRLLLRRLTFPIYKRLLAHDRVPSEYRSSPMLSHLCATATRAPRENPDTPPVTSGT